MNKKTTISIIVVTTVCLQLIGMIPYGIVNAEGTGSYPPPETGTWVINSTTQIWNETIIRNGSIVITAGGSLTLNNVTLEMNPTRYPQAHTFFAIEVQKDGALYIYNSTIKQHNYIDATYAYTIIIEAGAIFEVRNSEIRDTGSVVPGATGIPWTKGAVNIQTDNTIIENTNFYNLPGWALFFYSSSNNTIMNCSIEGSYDDIWLIKSNNTTIENCYFAAVHTGVDIGYNPVPDIGPGYEVTNTTISNCTFTNNMFALFVEYPSNNIKIVNCTILMSSVSGIYISSFNNTVNGCKISDQHSISLGQAAIRICGDKNTITMCNISRNQCGIWVEGVENKIYHNNFIDNNISHVDNSGLESSPPTDIGVNNSWDDGYPSGGNYWSDYTGVDLYSGVNQNQPGSDGVGDTPYNISGKNPPSQDLYPLMSPYEDILINKYDITAKNTETGDLKLQATIYNHGWADYSNVTLDFYNEDNDTLIGNITTSIMHQSTGAAEIPWTAEPGTYNITVKIDSLCLIRETHKYNNNATQTFTIPNLILKTENVAAENTQIGFQVTATVENKGSINLNNIPVEFYNNTQKIATTTINIPANTNTTTSTLYNPPTGTEHITVKIDPNYLFLETSKKDNTACIVADAIGIADLSITTTSIYFNPAIPTENENATINLIVHNTGFSTCQPVNISFYDNDILIDIKQLPAVGPGGQYVLSCYWPEAHKGHIIKTVINRDGVTEYDEGNNQAQTIVMETLMCDISITPDDIFFDPPVPTLNGTTLVYVRVNNRGAVSSGITTIKIYENTTLLKTITIDTILASSSKSVDMVWKARKGVMIKAEALSTAADLNPDNNIASKILENVHMPDLCVESIMFDPTNPQENQTIRVYASLYNDGNGSAENITIQFYDNNVLFSTTKISFIPPGEHGYTYTTWKAQQNHTIMVKIESSTDEDDVTNNQADMLLNEVYIPPEPPEPSTQIIMVAAGTGILSTLLMVFFIKKGKYGLLAFFPPGLAAKIERQEALNNATRSMIHTYVTAYPAVSLKNIQENFDIERSRLRWHLRILEREKHIKLRKEGRETRIYPIEDKDQSLPIAGLHRRTLLRKMLINVSEGVPQYLLAMSAGMSLPTVRKYMEDFERKGVVESDIRGKQRTYFFTEPKKKILGVLQRMKKTTPSNIASFLGISEGDTIDHLREMKNFGVVSTSFGSGGQTFYSL